MATDHLLFWFHISYLDFLEYVRLPQLSKTLQTTCYFGFIVVISSYLDFLEYMVRSAQFSKWQETTCYFGFIFHSVEPFHIAICY